MPQGATCVHTHSNAVHEKEQLHCGMHVLRLILWSAFMMGSRNLFWQGGTVQCNMNEGALSV